jgi:hypothetical protein
MQGKCPVLPRKTVLELSRQLADNDEPLDIILMPTQVQFRFGSIELVLALLLVQFVAIPYSLIFGRLPSKTDTRRPFFLAFILYNLVALPLAGIADFNRRPLIALTTILSIKR